MTQEANNYNLLQLLIKKSRLPWGWVAVAVTGTILLLGILAVVLDDQSAKLSDWGLWRSNLVGLALIAYMLVAPVFMWPLRDRAIEAFRPLLPQNKDDFDLLAAEASTPKRRWEWTSLLAGIGVALFLGQPWNLPWGAGDLWASVYSVITNTVFNALLAWLVYSSLAEAVRINRLSRRDMKIDVFDTELLTPVAMWSWGISFVFIGGISLSLVLVTWEELLSWQSISMYVVLVCSTLMVFFISMWSVHRAMSAAKNEKLAMTREHLVQLSRELEDRRTQGQLKEMQEIAATFNSWAAYHKLVQEVPTWPFNANILRRLLASTIVPVVVYLIKILAGLGIRF